MSGALVAEGYGVGVVCAVVGLPASSYYRQPFPMVTNRSERP